MLVMTELTTQLSPPWELWSSTVILASLAPRFTKVVTLSFLARVSMSPPRPRQMALMSADFPLLQDDHIVMTSHAIVYLPIVTNDNIKAWCRLHHIIRVVHKIFHSKSDNTALAVLSHLCRHYGVCIDI